MEILSEEDSTASIRLTYDELAIVYGALIEAWEALSPEEFQARVGRSVAEANRLREQLKPVLAAMTPGAS
jgi:hypothetical protein